MKSAYLLLVTCCLSLFVSCGSSTVNITNSSIKTSYTNVVVRNFACKVPSASAQAKENTNKVSDFIVSSVIAEKSFLSASKTGKISPDTLVIAGDITQYDEGNPSLRLIVGMGTGKASMSGDVRFIDGATNKVFGTMHVEDSIKAGGIIGAMRKPERMALGMAESIASESVQFSRAGNR
jgi:Domain of unknown function (DUF4410)